MLTTLKTIKTLPTLPEGRTYLVVAPFAWGRDRNIATAIKYCKANFSRTYGGEWRFRVYDAPGDTTLDAFGHSYTKSNEKAVEVARYKLTAKDLEA